MYRWSASWRQQGQDLLGQQPSPWLWDWSCSRCSFPPPPGSWSVSLPSSRLARSAGPHQSLAAAKLRWTLDNGHARSQQLNCSLTWKRQSSGKKPPRDRWVGVSLLRSWAGKTDYWTAVTDRETELTLLVSRWVHFCSKNYLCVRACVRACARSRRASSQLNLTETELSEHYDALSLVSLRVHTLSLGFWFQTPFCP